MRIALVSGKGGTGKTTLAYLLTMALAKAGQSVAVDDIDPQASLSRLTDRASWRDPEAENTITIVDTPPQIDSPAVLREIGIADRILIPTTPSPMDLMAVRATMEVIEATKQSSAGAMVVLNRLRGGTSFGAAAESMLEDLHVPVATAIIPERQGIQRAMVLGWPSMDPQTRETLLALAIEVIS